jgi:Flp pilus assembly protein TadB
MSKIWQMLAAALGFIALVLGALLKGAQWQRDAANDRAEKQRRRADTSEERIEQRQAADKASANAKAEGDEHVENVRNEARSGKRDHFESGWVRDED